MESYRIKWKGQESGPYTEPELREMLANREIRNMHEVEVAGEWKTIRSFFKERDQPASRDGLQEAESLAPPKQSATPLPVKKEPPRDLQPVPSAPEDDSVPLPRPSDAVLDPSEKPKEPEQSVPDFVSREVEGALATQQIPKEEKKKERPPKARKSIFPKPDISDQVMKQTRAGEFLVHAGFWYRVLAALADAGIIYVLPVMLLGQLFQKDFSLTDPIAVLREFVGLGLLGIALLALATILVWLYFASMESSRKRGTLGKMIFGLVVTDEIGNRISFQRASLRFFSKLASALILFAGFFLAAFTRRKQGLHDLISRCTVNHSLPPTRLLRRTPDRS